MIALKFLKMVGKFDRNIVENMKTSACLEYDS